MPTAFPSGPAAGGAPEAVPSLGDLLAGRAALADAGLPPPADLDDLADLPEPVRELIADRLEAALVENVLVPERLARRAAAGDLDWRQLTTELYANVLCALLPDEAVVRPTGPPCPDPVGTPGRAAAYAARAGRGEAVCSAADADPAADDRARGVRVRPRANGAGKKAAAGEPDCGLKVLGFAAPEAPAPAAGLYRTAGGEWFELAGA
jgi:hypothetical protein